MKEWVRTLVDAALLRTEAFTRFRDRLDVFFQGFLIVVAVALLTGLPGLVRGVVDAATPRSAEAQLEQATARLEAALAQMEPYLSSASPAAQEQVAQIVRAARLWTAAGIEIANLPALLPRPVGRVLEAFGAWLSLPFTKGGLPLTAAALSIWLGYGVWVMLLAKLLGGRGTLAGFLGTSALYAVPHVLTVFAFIPCLGPLLGLAAVVWGAVIYVKATAVSHHLSAGRAAVAVLVPAAALALIASVVAASVAALTAAAVFRLQ